MSRDADRGPEKDLTSVTVRLVGCDDETYFGIEVNPDELALLHKLRKLSKETSEFGCQPRMIVLLRSPNAEPEGNRQDD